MLIARLALADASVRLHLSISPAPVSMSVPSQLRLSCVEESLEPLLSLDDWCRRLALVMRIAASITAGRKVRQHTLESSVGALVDATDHLLHGHDLRRRLWPVAGTVPRQLQLCDVWDIESFWLGPIEATVQLLCLVRVRAAPEIPWDIWEAVVLEVLAQDRKHGSRSTGCLIAGGLRSPPPRDVVRRFGYDRGTRKLRVSLVNMEPVPPCWEIEAAALSALLTKQDHKAVCGLAAACSLR